MQAVSSSARCCNYLSSDMSTCLGNEPSARRCSPTRLGFDAAIRPHANARLFSATAAPLSSRVRSDCFRATRDQTELPCAARCSIKVWVVSVSPNSLCAIRRHQTHEQVPSRQCLLCRLCMRDGKLVLAARRLRWRFSQVDKLRAALPEEPESGCLRRLSTRQEPAPSSRSTALRPDTSGVQIRWRGAMRTLAHNRAILLRKPGEVENRGTSPRDAPRRRLQNPWSTTHLCRQLPSRTH